MIINIGNRLTRVSGPCGAGLIIKMPPKKWLAEAMVQKRVTTTTSKTATRHNIAGVSLYVRLQRLGPV